MDELVNLLGGRAAEELALNEISTGASNDLERVTRIARKMVMEWGMSARLGPLTFGRPNGEDLVFLGRDISRERNYSEGVAEIIDEEVHKIVESSYEAAKEILTKYRDKLDAVAEALLERETLNREEFLALMGKSFPDLDKPEVPEHEIIKQEGETKSEVSEEVIRGRSEKLTPRPETSI